MLKFKNNYNTTIATFEDFILTIFVLIDDLYNLYAPPEITNRRNIAESKLSDSEVITITLCGEITGHDSEKAWFSFVKRNYKYLFPDIGERSRFNRKRRNLLQVTELLRQKLMSYFSMITGNVFIVDSFPLPVCEFGRARYCKSFRGYGADYGRCPSKKQTYYGYKVHAVTTSEGYVAAFEITSASIDDREGLKDMIADCSGLTIIGDKGYFGQPLSDELASNGITIYALLPKHQKKQYPKEFTKQIFKIRRRIETVFSQLTELLNAERVLAKSFWGLCTRIQNKILAHNLCMVINRLFYPDLDIGKIKHLIF